MSEHFGVTSSMDEQELLRQVSDGINRVLSARGLTSMKPAKSCDELEKDPAFYSVEVDEGYEQGLIYLPCALDIMAQMRNDHAFVAECLCGFLKTWQESLRADTLLSDTLACVAAAFRHWNSRFSPTGVALDDAGEPIYESGPFDPPPSDRLLDCLMDAKIIENGDEFFDRLLSAWVADTSSAQSSANVLDFALRVRCKPGWLKLYRSRKVLDCVFNTALLQCHWRTARRLLEEVSSVDYCRAVESLCH